MSYDFFYCETQKTFKRQKNLKERKVFVHAMKANGVQNNIGSRLFLLCFTEESHVFRMICSDRKKNPKRNEECLQSKNKGKRKALKK